MSTLGLTHRRTDDKPYWCEERAWECLAQIMSGTLGAHAAFERRRMQQGDVQEWLRGFHRSALLAFDERLRRALIHQGASPEALSGPELCLPVSEISVADWIQAMILFAKPAVITVLHDGTESRLWCSKGALIDAESGRLRGEAAVYRILGLEHGHVVTELRSVRRERTIRSSTQGLLLEAAQRKDEAAVLRRRLGDLDRHFQASEMAVQRSLNTAETATLRLFPAPRRLSDVLAQSDLGDFETLAALESLIRAGVLVAARAVNEPRATVVPPPGEAGEPGGTPLLPVSFAFPREHTGWGSVQRWLASTACMALCVSLAAWLGAKNASTSTPRGAGAAPVAAPPVGGAPSAVASIGAEVSAPLALGAPPPEAYSVVIRAYPFDATLEVDGRGIGGSYWTARLPRDGTQHEVRVSAAGFVPARILFVDTPPQPDIRLDPLPPLHAAPAGGAAAEGGDVATPAPAVAIRRLPKARRGAAPSREAAPRATAPTAELPRARKKKPHVQIIDGETTPPRAARP